MKINDSSQEVRRDTPTPFLAAWPKAQDTTVFFFFGVQETTIVFFRCTRDNYCPKKMLKFLV